MDFNFLISILYHVFMKNRLEYLDVLRGAAVILVIFGHSLQSSFVEYPKLPLYHLIYSIHVPLFVFVSGYLYRFQLKKKINNFITNRFIRLFIPYLIWMSVIALVLRDALVTSNILHFFARGILLPQTPWFLYILFFSFCVTFIILKSKSRAIYLVFILIVLIINMLKTKFINNEYMLSISSILHYSLIQFCGFLFEKFRKTAYKFSILISSVLFVSVYFLNNFEFLNLSYFYPFKLLTTFSLIYISFYAVVNHKLLSKNKYLVWCGQHALQLYVVHYLFIVFIPYKNSSLIVLLISFIAITGASVLLIKLFEMISATNQFFRAFYQRVFGIIP